MNIVVATPVNGNVLDRIRSVASEAELQILPNATLLTEEHAAWAEVVFGNCAPDWLRLARRVRWVQLTSNGFERYLELEGKAPVITTGRGLTSAAGAEHILGCMVMFARQIPHFQARQRERVWDRRPQIVGTLQGKTLGIVGYGTIGQALAVRARAMGMKVIASKREAAETVPPELDALGDGSFLDELLSSSDHVAVVVPLTRETRGLLGAEKLWKLRHGAFLYNLSRGGIVDEPALIHCLCTGQIAGAALDVFAEEPLPPENPFWGMSNVILTPHLGASWNGVWDAALNLFLENLARFRAGRPLLNVANLARGY